ncbi:MAG: metallophosphoesterase [Candidatus Hydrothermarchaeaceae archaeon]
MKLLCVTDIHGRMASVERLVSNKPSCDALVVAGDITNFGGAREAKAILDALSSITSNLVAVPGNCDKGGVNEYLAESGLGIHGSWSVIDDIGFFGIGGSNITPFGTPQEYSEDTIQEILARAYESVGDSDVKVLVSHAPPYTTKLDISGRGEHVGSRSVRRFLDENAVDLVVTGHMHEAKGTDTLGKTTLLNPGPLHMGYAIVKVGEGDVDVEFHAL